MDNLKDFIKTLNVLYVEDDFNAREISTKIFRKFFNWDFLKVFKLSCEYIDNGKFSFFGLNPILDISNFNTIHTKSDIFFYVLEYNEKYKQFDIPLNYEIDSKKLEEINEMKNEI